MKNRNFLKNSIALLLPISMGIGVLFGTSNKSVREASAYNGVSLPTTIKLNDPDESTIRNYYSNLNSLSENERKGNNLLKNLKTILSNGQKYYNYDSGNLVWDMYEITDRDWELSPASSIKNGTYDASTNTISNYVYEAGKTDESKNPYIRAYYMDRNQTNVVKAWGNHNQDATGINREHLWAKAEGFDGSGAAGARGDPMHLVAANGYANNIHSNYFYGYVDKTKSYEDVSNKYSTLGHNLRGTSKTYPSYSQKVFEPQDCDKGDIARAIFYMAARYNNIAGKSASQETFDADNPNLLLTNDLSKWKSSGYTSTATSPGYHGLITDLLEWNRIDKPDAYEIHRNNLLYTNFTNNRNPFIDFPEWADYIWGDKSSYATPTTDTLNGGGGGTPTVTVTSLEITKKPTKLVYNVGDTLVLDGMVVKANKSDGTSQTLTSSQYSVEPNRALKTSDTEVTISYGGKSASFAIAVKSSGGGTSGETQNLKFTFNSAPSGWPSGSNASEIEKKYTIGNQDYSFLLGKNVYFNTTGYLMLKATTYLGLPAIDGYKLTKVVAKNSSTCSTSTKVGISSSSSTESYINGGNTQTFKTTSGSYTFNLTNTNDNTKYYLYITSANCQLISLDLTFEPVASTPSIDVTSISLNKTSLSLEIGASEKLIPTISPDDATIKLVSWSSSDSSVVEVSDNGDITAKSAGNAVITCSALDGSNAIATCSVTVKEPVTLQSLSLSGEYATEFYLNDEFSNTGMIVTAHYSDGSEVDVSDEAECSGFDSTTTGTKTITVSYGGVNTTYMVTVKETRLDSNQRLFVASKQGVGNGENLTSYQDDPITVVFKKNTSSNYPKYYSTTQSYRLYWGNSLTISSTKKITQIEFEMASSDTVGANTISADVGNLTGNKWTGNANDITFTVAGTSGQRNIVSIKVTYDEDSEDIVILKSISLSGTYKTNFFVGDDFSSEGLVVTAHYSDNSYKEVTPASISHQSMSTPGEKTVTVFYTEGSITKDAGYLITVTSVITTSIELTGNYKTTFIQGEEYDPTGMRITEYYNNGGHSAAHYPTSQGCTITGYDKDEIGEQTIKVDWNGVYTTYNVNVIARPSAKVFEQNSGAYYLVKDTASLKAGDTFLIVGIKNNEYYAMNSYSEGNNIKCSAINATPDADGVIRNPEEGLCEYKLGGNAGNWTLKGGSYYLYAAGGTGKNNYLKGADNADNLNAQWTISLSSTDGSATIKTVDTDVARHTMRFNLNGNNAPLFACYAEGQENLYLYRYEKRSVLREYFASIDLTKALISAQSILDVSCSAKNVTTANWNSIKGLISPFLSDSATDDYKALMFGKAKSSELDGNMLEDFLARYDLITSTYGYEKFIANSSRTEVRASTERSNLTIKALTSDNILLIVCTSIAILAIGGYFFFKRKKEEI